MKRKALLTLEITLNSTGQVTEPMPKAASSRLNWKLEPHLSEAIMISKYIYKSGQQGGCWESAQTILRQGLTI